jgi:hypothetical protein
MSTAFPTALDTIITLPNPGAADALDNSNANLKHDYQHTFENDAIRALETKLGIDSSADTSSIDYLLKNTASSNPGHKHTLSSLSDFNVSSPSDGQALTYDNGTGKWINTTISGMAIGSAIGNSPNANSILFVDGSGNLGQDTNLVVDSTNHRIGIGATSPGYRLDIKKDAQGTAPSDGLNLNNSTAATSSSLLQHSPVIYFDGSGWNQVSTPAAESVNSRVGLETTSVASAHPLVSTSFRFNVNSSAYGNNGSIHLTSDGNIYFGTVNNAATGSPRIGASGNGGALIVHAGSAAQIFNESDTHYFMNNSGSTHVIIDAANGRMFIGGNTSPTTRLQLNGTGATNGINLGGWTLYSDGTYLKTDNSLYVAGVRAGIGVSPSSTVTMNVAGTFTTTGASAVQSALFLLTASPASSSAAQFIGFEGIIQTSGSQAFTNQCLGVYGVVQHNATSTLANATAVQAITTVGTGATITTAVGVRILTPTGSGTIGTLYGLRIDDMSGVGTTHYAIYSLGGDSYHVGNFGINSATAPSGAAGCLMLASGTGPTGDPTSSQCTIWSDSSNGLQYRNGVSNEGAGQANHVHNRASSQVGAGTDYSCTTSLAEVTFGTTNPSISLPTAGTYLLSVAFEIVTGGSANDDYAYELYNHTDTATIGISRTSTNFGANVTRSLNVSELVTITASKTVTFRAANLTGARGTITSTQTKISYIRLY